MFKNRLFNLLIAIALVITLAFTVQEAFATSALRAEGSTVAVCDSLPSRYSIRSEYVRAMDNWVIVTEEGPTGLDGGLIQLMSDYRTCTK